MKYEKAMAELQAQLHPGEQILTAAKASLRQIQGNGKQGDALAGAAALTASRMMFVGSLLLQKQSFSIPLASIVSIDGLRQAFVPYSVITVQGGVSHRFYELPADFRAAIDQARFAGVAAAPAPRPAAAQSGGIDQLTQLVGMHQSGVLTDAEFTAAKARLLGL